MSRLLFLIVALHWLPGSGLAQRVALRDEAASVQSRYAVRRLTDALQTRGCRVMPAGASADLTIRIAPLQAGLGSEAYAVERDGNRLTITGGDARGLIYGTLSVAEALLQGTSALKLSTHRERPHLPFRALKFDLPWDTYRHSYALDQHYATCRDTLYWRAFLDMMATNRFNVLTLWNLHPYPFMIRPVNFPKATTFSDAELHDWQRLFRSIFRMAGERGIETYLVPFNIFTSPAFSTAYNPNPRLNNLDHKHFVDGDTSAIVRQYTRECVTQVLQEYPELTGFGLTLGEGMGGMTPRQREAWMAETILAGMQRAGRKTKLIHRIPFSSTTGSLGVTSVDTEVLTRQALEREGRLDFLDGPVWADLKYNWSHAHSTPKLVKVHGGKLYDTYFKPVSTAYKIVWTARNEDFFCLRWGAPDFIRTHIATNQQPYVGGYILGSETYIPAKDYFTSPGAPVSWTYAFERQWLFYALWGRLLYNPATPDAVFRHEFVRRYGRQASPLLAAYALASRTPLRLAAAFDFTWDFSLYSEGMMAHDSAKNVSYISVDQHITQPPLDPSYVSVRDYVTATIAGKSFRTDQTTPIQLATQLDTDCRQALALLTSIRVSGNRSLAYEVADIRVWANLGLHLAAKLRGAVALHRYRTTGNEAQKTTAIRELTAALRYWDTVIAITRPIYNDMPLVHLSEQKGATAAQNDQLRFHWALLRPAVVADIDLARRARPDVSK